MSEEIVKDEIKEKKAEPKKAEPISGKVAFKKEGVTRIHDISERLVLEKAGWKLVK